MRTPKHRWSDPAKRTESVVRMREAGWSFRRIAADLGVSVGTVHRDLSLWADEQHAGQRLGPALDKAIAQNHVNRARQAGVPWEWVSVTVVAERDRWQCGICREPVPASWGDKGQMPSLDHVVPMSQGGAHLYSNVQLSHLACNLSKGARESAPPRPQLLTVTSLTDAAYEAFRHEALRELSLA